MSFPILDAADELIARLVQDCRTGHVEGIEAFLASGGDPSARIAFGYNPAHPVALLQIALQHGHADLALRLLDAGVQADYIDETGANLLAWGLFSAQVTRRLLALGLRPAAATRNERESVLACAVRQSGSTPETLSLLLDAGADIELGLIEPYTRRRLAQPIHLAASGHRLDLLLQLLARGADLQARDAAGNGLLHRAAGSVHGGAKADIPMLVQLIGLGLHPDALNAKGNGPLHIAARCGFAENCATLLAHGATVDQPNSHGETALVIAVENGHAQVAAILLRAGADPQARTRNGRAIAAHAGFPPG